MSLRIPLSSARSTRIEHRVAGADANPYLVVACILAGMHHGITQQLEPEPMTQLREQIEFETTLPVRWTTSLDAFSAGTVLPGYFGRQYHQLFEDCQREQSDQFNAEVSNRDYEWYLRSV